MPGAPSRARRLVLFTKPAVPGRVKTRLVGDGPGALSAGAAAELHLAFLGDVGERLLAAAARGELDLLTAWALDAHQDTPMGPGEAFRQEGATLGDRLFHGLARAVAKIDTAGAAVVATDRKRAAVAALGSDHPTVTIATVRDAFERIEGGAEVVVGPSDDGGYFLIALAPHAVRPELFDGVAWSTDAVLDQTVERAEALGLALELLPAGFDVDTPDDLVRLATELRRMGAAEAAALCPRTRALLASWGRLSPAEETLAGAGR